MQGTAAWFGAEYGRDKLKILSRTQEKVLLGRKKHDYYVIVHVIKA